MTLYFGFAVADGMFAGDCEITRRVLTLNEAKAILAQGVTSCLNPSHTATIKAMTARFGIEVPIPESPPKVALDEGDSLVVMSVRGLPRLTDRHEYTDEEVAAATFAFALYTIH
jgi:hypothetical protein